MTIFASSIAISPKCEGFRVFYQSTKILFVAINELKNLRVGVGQKISKLENL